MTPAPAAALPSAREALEALQAHENAWRGAWARAVETGVVGTLADRRAGRRRRVRVTTTVHADRWRASRDDALAVACPICGAGVSAPCEVTR